MLWWVTVGVAAVLIFGISASRVYLDVHWFTDLVQGVLLGSLYLAAVEFVFAHNHRLRECAVTEAVPAGGARAGGGRRQAGGSR